MSSLIGVMLALLAGAALGIMYFCGLLWTIQRSLVSSQPGLWFFASFLLRTSLAVGGFYLLSATLLSLLFVAISQAKSHIVSS